MTRYLFPILVVLILGFPVLPKADPLNSIYIEENDKGITIRVDDASLSEVLQSIEATTGIQFHISPSILNDRITTSLNAPDWQISVKLLLEPYGRAELWNPRLDLTEIHILSRADDTADPSPLAGYTAYAPPLLNRKQLGKIGKGSLRTPLPPELFDDPEIRAFLNYYEIYSWHEEDVEKARNVRIKARKLVIKMPKAKNN